MIFETIAKRSEMDEESYRRAKHAITEIARTIEAANALSANDLVKLGKLMNDSHDSLRCNECFREIFFGFGWIKLMFVFPRDDFNVSCEELDSLVEIARKTNGVYGSRMTGGGFGGCTVTLIKTSAVQDLIKNVVDNYKSKASFYVCKPCDGAKKL
jgi:galactokinase